MANLVPLKTVLLQDYTFDQSLHLHKKAKSRALGLLFIEKIKYLLPHLQFKASANIILLDIWQRQSYLH
ncbi:hypothetical protein D3C76_603430 [compost metagenome]